MTRLLIIGGSDAGISAALRARELDTTAEITVVLADSFPNYSVCGLPFYVSGEVPLWQYLAHRTEQEIRKERIVLLQNYHAESIDPTKKIVKAVDQNKQPYELPYDKLILATGAEPAMPNITGLSDGLKKGLPGLYILRSMASGIAIQQYLTTQAPKSAVLIGGGYIGLEMADALTLRGIDVTLVERSPTVLKTVDSFLGKLVEAELDRNKVRVAANVNVTALELQQGGQWKVTGSNKFEVAADLVLVATGVKPSTELAETAKEITMGKEKKITIGEKTHAIVVDRTMVTNFPDIYAAGDCVETWHHLLKESMFMPLGTTAHKQGRIAGENAVRGPTDSAREFEGTLGTQVVKIFELAVARTGLKDSEIEEINNKAGKVRFDYTTIESLAWDHEASYHAAHELRFRVTGDKTTGQFLGAQILGHYRGEVAKRIDIFATALFHGMTVEALSALDLSYTPPLSSPWDPVQTSAQAWCKRAHTA